MIGILDAEAGAAKLIFMNLKPILAAGTLLFTAAESSAITFQDDIIDGGSAAGLNLNQGGNENNLARLFTEKQGVILPGAVSLDRVPPTFGSSGTLAAGSLVNSYLFHFDLPGTPSLTEISGSVTFDQPILGLIFSWNNLLATDSTLGLASSYYNHSTRGLEAFSQDSWSISGGTLTFNFEFGAAEGVDNVRILTAVPDAGATAGLLALGVGLLSLRFRKQ